MYHVAIVGSNRCLYLPYMSCIRYFSITGQFITGSDVECILLVRVFIFGLTEYVSRLVETHDVWPLDRLYYHSFVVGVFAFQPMVILKDLKGRERETD